MDFLDLGLYEELVLLIVHFIYYNQRMQGKLGNISKRGLFLIKTPLNNENIMDNIGGDSLF